MSRLPAEELRAIKQAFYAPQLDSPRIIASLENMRCSFRTAVPYAALETTPMLQAHMEEANGVFGREIFRAMPVIAISRYVHHSECFALNLRELVLAREEARRDCRGLAGMLRRIWGAVRNVQELPRPDAKTTMSEYLEESIRAQEAYLELRSSKEASLAQSIETADWSAAQMRYLRQTSPPPAPLQMGEERNAMDILLSTTPEMVLVSVRDAIVDPATKDVLTLKTFGAKN